VLPAESAAQAELLAQLLGGDDAEPAAAAGPVEEDD
jgi:hypothetical protein